MRNDLPSDQYKDSRVVGAHNYFKNAARTWLEAFPEDNGRRTDAAEALEGAVSDHLELVVIDLGQTDDAHVIFETLNARGTPLLPSDMIKNQILHKAGIGAEEEDRQSYQRVRTLWSFDEDWWRQEIGRGYQRRPRVDVFLNNWLSLRTKTETRAHDEFNAFSKYVESPDTTASIHTIASDLGKLGDIYRRIEERKIPEIEAFLYRRQVMGIGVVVPVLMWILASDVPTVQVAKAIAALESYLVRRMACGMGARSYGTLFVGLISELEASGPPYAGDTVVRYLGQQTAQATVWPNDHTLLNRFTAEPLYWSLTSGRINLILQGIEGELRTNLAETQSVPRNLHIEHVMPQGWRENWPLPCSGEPQDETAAKRDRLVHSVGNLTLVSQRLNSVLSNAPWQGKKEQERKREQKGKKETLAEHTVLFLNKDLLATAPVDWDEEAIIKRSMRLHAAAIRVWPHAVTIG